MFTAKEREREKRREASAAHDPKTMTQRLEFINYAGGADLLLETYCVVLTGTGR